MNRLRRASGGDGLSLATLRATVGLLYRCNPRAFENNAFQARYGLVIRA